MGVLFPTWQRTKQVRGTVPLAYLHFGYGTAPLQPVISYTKTLKPFQTSVWLALGASLIGLTLAVLVMSGNDTR